MDFHLGGRAVCLSSSIPTLLNAAADSCSSSTCVVAIIWFFTISDFPEDAKWLSSAERNYIRARLQADSGRAALERRTNFNDVANFFKDYKVVLGGLMYLGLIVPAYGYAYFSPTIIQSYGYGQIESKFLAASSVHQGGPNVGIRHLTDKFVAQLHSVPPYALTLLSCLVPKLRCANELEQMGCCLGSCGMIESLLYIAF